MELDKKQLEAFNMATSDIGDIIYISGYAGTGKSITILEIEKKLKSQGWLVSKVAPTGKAAKRIDGTTIHSWLQPDVEENDYGDLIIKGYNKASFSNKEVLIVDEASMIDDEIWNEIMLVYTRTQFRNKKIIFVGDVGQLEPVGKGTPFIDGLKKSDKKITLDKIHRNKDGNDIVLFANAIRNGEKLETKYKDVEISTMDKAIEMTLEDIDNNQILATTNLQVKDINTIIQKKMNLEKKIMDTLKFDKGNGRWRLIKDREIYIGDKILITKNYSPLGLTNGTTGIVIKDGYKEVPVMKFGFSINQSVYGIFIEESISGEELFIPHQWGVKAIDLAYALTVHKFQGSESNFVHFIWPKNTYYVDTKMKYTAVTRAKEKLYLIQQ